MPVTDDCTMTGSKSLKLDVLIFGGGVAGLWLLDDLVRRGCNVLLLEADALGSGQTIASQGIIHGGLKYTLSGLFTSSARAVRNMPNVWRRCLAGEQEPNLSHVRRKTDYCFIWQTATLASRVGMIGAKRGLRTRPVALPVDERPEALRECPGTVARIDEQVIDPQSLLEVLAERHADRLLQIDAHSGLEFNTAKPGHVELVRLINPTTGDPLDIQPNQIIFTAGAGNAWLRKLVQLPTHTMQLRPLHMVATRGKLPLICGHCVDGMHTRATITAERDYADRTLWLVGGQIAEDGVSMEPTPLIEHAQRELSKILPAVDLSGGAWTTYRVDRAEGVTRSGIRPSDAQIICEGNCITGWPTKLVLVPEMTKRIVRVLDLNTHRTATVSQALADWPRPQVAPPPWDEEEPWIIDPSAQPASS